MCLIDSTFRSRHHQIRFHKRNSLTILTHVSKTNEYYFTCVVIFTLIVLLKIFIFSQVMESWHTTSLHELEIIVNNVHNSIVLVRVWFYGNWFSVSRYVQVVVVFLKPRKNHFKVFNEPWIIVLFHASFDIIIC